MPVFAELTRQSPEDCLFKASQVPIARSSPDGLFQKRRTLGLGHVAGASEKLRLENHVLEAKMGCVDLVSKKLEPNKRPLGREGVESWGKFFHLAQSCLRSSPNCPG